MHTAHSNSHEGSLPIAFPCAPQEVRTSRTKWTIYGRACCWVPLPLLMQRVDGRATIVFRGAMGLTTSSSARKSAVKAWVHGLHSAATTRPRMTQGCTGCRVLATFNDVRRGRGAAGVGCGVWGVGCGGCGVWGVGWWWWWWWWWWCVCVFSGSGPLFSLAFGSPLTLPRFMHWSCRLTFA